MNGTSTIQPDDYVMTPTGPLGSKISLTCGNKHLGNFSTVEESLVAIVERMKKENYFPTIWWVSDHGNCCPVDGDGNEVKESS